jgi:hypothetical protein
MKRKWQPKLKKAIKKRKKKSNSNNNTINNDDHNSNFWAVDLFLFLFKKKLGGQFCDVAKVTTIHRKI